MRKTEYVTKQKDMILEILKTHSISEGIRVKDIQEFSGNKLSTPTLYRILDYFFKKNIIRKIKDENSYKYQYIDNEKCSEHFHMFCNKCKKTIHLDCDYMKGFMDHIIDEHKFKLELNSFILEGICSSCNK